MYLGISKKIIKNIINTVKTKKVITKDHFILSIVKFTKLFMIFFKINSLLIKKIGPIIQIK